MNLPLSLIVNVTEVLAQLGIGEFNTSNIAIFTPEPYQESFGSLGYSIYFSGAAVAADFGSTSRAALMATAIFSQVPSIIVNEGYVVVIPLIVTEQTLTFSGVAASGTFEITSTNGSTAAINWNDTVSVIQTKLQAVTGQTDWTVTGSIASESLVINTWKTYGPVTLFTISANSLETSGTVAITVTPAVTIAGETIAAAITRTYGLVPYFGMLSTIIPDQADTLAAAAVAQPLLLMPFFPSRETADIAPGGTLDLLRTGGFSQSRGLYYGASAGVASDTNTLTMAAAYAGRGLCVDFQGSDTTITMNLATLETIQPDSTMTLDIYNSAKTAGVDVYASIQGSPSVISNGANFFFDDVYNGLWFKSDLAINGFNFLKETNTKIPQTEQGMDGLKGAYQVSCNTANTNGYLAPGTWDIAVPFGNQQNFLNAISQFGFYIYSTPISQQAPSVRATRAAPLVQIAGKTAGAIQSSSVIVTINQ